MKKLLLPAIILFVTLILPIDIFASSLEVSKSTTFSGTDTNFAGGETVYVRVKTDKAGSSSVLNVRDNNYSTINTINLSRSGDSYSASFSTPSAEGYYSLEAKIEGDGMNVTSVKTIKVGNPNSANIKVNVNSSVKGTKSVSQSRSVESQESQSQSKESEGIEKTNDVEVFSAQEEPNIDIEEHKDSGFFGMIFGVFEGAWNLIKFF